MVKSLDAEPSPMTARGQGSRSHSRTFGPIMAFGGSRLVTERAQAFPAGETRDSSDADPGLWPVGRSRPGASDALR
jgi:hypothetical protein